MIENESQIREIISQYEELVKRAEYIVHMTKDCDFTAKYFDTDPRVLSDRSKADSNISICGTNRYIEYDHWDIPVAWLLMSDEELKEAISEKKRKEAEERARREEELKKRAAEEQAIADKKVEECERRTLALLIEKYGVDGGIKDD